MCVIIEKIMSNLIIINYILLFWLKNCPRLNSGRFNNYVWGILVTQEVRKK
jgi:hypothetical protein